MRLPWKAVHFRLHLPWEIRVTNVNTPLQTKEEERKLAITSSSKRECEHVVTFGTGSFRLLHQPLSTVAWLVFHRTEAISPLSVVSLVGQRLDTSVCPNLIANVSAAREQRHGVMLLLWWPTSRSHQSRDIGSWLASVSTQPHVFILCVCVYVYMCLREKVYK